MVDDWPKVAKVIISAVPAVLILLGFILLAGIECTTYVKQIVDFGVFMIIGGAVLFVFEIVIIYYSK